MQKFEFALIGEDIGFWISFIKGYDEDFESHDWKNASEARRLVDAGKQIIAEKPNKEALREIVGQLFALLPSGDKPILDKSNMELLRK